MTQDFDTEEFTPSVCKDDGETKAAFEGTITIRIPDIEERYQLIETVGIVKGAQNEDQVEKARAHLRHMVAIATSVKPFIVSAKLKRVSDGREFKSYEQISRSSDLDGTLIEVATYLAKSGALSKN